MPALSSDLAQPDAVKDGGMAAVQDQRLHHPRRRYRDEQDGEPVDEGDRKSVV